VTVLERYPWPGNVRELRNAVERLLLLADGEVDDSLVGEALPRTSAASPGLAANGTGPLLSRVEAFERATILSELERTRHNMTETAKALGLERSHLYKKCTQLGIQVKQLRHTES
jgi:DNA-binding NtrC family response regulator